MYFLNTDAINVTTFLKEYWQKKPVFIKGGFSDFADPITPDELAGLAAESEISSRIVSIQNSHTDVRFGPFEDYEGLGENNWTLLVQATDFWNSNCAELVKPFRFIPNWRIDDLMVSFSLPNGGVGPHLDQYDVFIIQGMGKRHWRVGDIRDDYEVDHSHEALARIKRFDAIIDVVTEPGDILYIPPNFPHEGYAIEPSLNYSIGFRAPNQEDLFSSFADKLIDDCADSERFTDAGRQQQANNGELLKRDAETIQALMLKKLQDPVFFNQWLGCYLTESKRDMNLIPVDDEYQSEELNDVLDDDQTTLYRTGGLRCCFLLQEHTIQVFVNNERYELPIADKQLAIWLCDYDELNADQARSFMLQPHSESLLLTLINAGYWYVD